MGKKRFVPTIICYIGTLLILFLPSAVVFAQGNLRLGRLSVTPGFRYAFNYDSNVFFEPTDEHDDFIHLLSPSILLGYSGSTPDNYFQAGYNGDFALYTDLTDNNWQRHSPFVSFGYGSPLGFYLKLSDNFTYSEDPFGSFNEFNQSNQFGLGEKTKRWDNLANILLGYRFGSRYFSEVFYTNYVIRYDQDKDKWQDRIDNRVGIAGFYRITPKTSLFLEYRGTFAGYDKQDDGIFDPGRGVNWSKDTSQDYSLSDLLIGARFESGGKLSGEAKLGYGKQEFKNSVDPIGFPYKDWDGLVISTYVAYQATARTNLLLNLQHSPLGSPDADAASFVNTLLQLQLRQALAYRLSLNLRGTYNLDDYQNERPGRPKKYFNRFEFQGGIDWAVKPWCTAGFEYEYREQVASDDFYASSEWTVNRVTAYVSFVY